MRLWCIGGGPFAARCLEALVRRLPVERVVTGTPTRGGRGMAEISSRVEERALALGLPLERTGPLCKNEPLLTALATEPPDAVLVVDFAQLIREPLLSAPRWGCLNVHPSLLPRWRGAAPVPRSLMGGDARTGVTVFRLTPVMDAGPILRQAAVEVGVGETATELYDRLSALGAEIAAEGLSALESAGDDFADLFTPQDDAAASYAAKLDRSEFELSWQQPAERARPPAAPSSWSAGSASRSGAPPWRMEGVKGREPCWPSRTALSSWPVLPARCAWRRCRRRASAGSRPRTGPAG